MNEANCIFCKIVSGDIPTELVSQTESVVAFRDIAPLAKVHFLVIPKNHHANVVELSDRDPEVLKEVLAVATALAKSHTSGAFKLQFNTGAEAGQTVFHAHAHVLSDFPKVSS